VEKKLGIIWNSFVWWCKWFLNPFSYFVVTLNRGTIPTHHQQNITETESWQLKDLDFRELNLIQDWHHMNPYGIGKVWSFNPLKPEQVIQLVCWQFSGDLSQSGHEGEISYQAETVEDASSPKGPASFLYISVGLQEIRAPSFPESRVSSY
jgi:hypothetical protein